MRQKKVAWMGHGVFWVRGKERYFAAGSAGGAEA